MSVPALEPSGRQILAVDDDPSVRRVLSKILGRAGYDVRTVGTGEECLSEALADPPDLIALDVILPDMDGFEVCRQLKDLEELHGIPIVFLTTLWRAQDRTRAFRVGASDWVQKPFEPNELLTAIENQIDTHDTFRKAAADQEAERAIAPAHWTQWGLPQTFRSFLNHLGDAARMEPEEIESLGQVAPIRLYSSAEALGISAKLVAESISEFLGVPYLPSVVSDQLRLGVLPTAFCQHHRVAPIAVDSEVRIACSNPFDWELLDTLGQTLCQDDQLNIAITVPENLYDLLQDVEGADRVRHSRDGEAAEPEEPVMELLKVVSEHDDVPHVPDQHPILLLANEVLRTAVASRASDVHIEAKANHTLVRCRVDGDMHDVRTLEPEAAPMLISRFKALAGMDIAERRKPQDGALEVMLGDRRFKLRLATSLASDGESLVIRLLEPAAGAVSLDKLGMTEPQQEVMHELAGRHQGMILVVGPTGSGKSTTIFSLLSAVNGQVRSIMSVEDPVEYRIPYANQQQVNEKAGATFESLLRSAMRQDPDILFLGEVRDQFSAKASMDFASSGHLTVTTLHSSNATTAIFRLERLGISRGAMADSLLAVVAQKLLKKLCDECKVVGPITDEERAHLGRFTSDIPETVARPVGCERCRGTGYFGREGCYEIMRFDPELGARVRRGDSVAEIRAFAEERGDFLISQHALAKVREHLFSPEDVFQSVLLEEVRFKTAAAAHNDAVPGATQVLEALTLPTPGAQLTSAPSGVHPLPTSEVPQQAPQPTPTRPQTVQGAGTASGRILVVDDDPDARAMINAFLTAEGYVVDQAEDGIDALMKLGQNTYDLILSDLNMPNLDGFKLMEMIVQKGITTPTAFLTGADSDEVEGQLLEMGAAEYIRKPIRQSVLVARVSRTIKNRRPQ